MPLELIAAIDISGSMAPAMPKLKKAVKQFLGDVPPQDQVTLLGFNDSSLHAKRPRKTTDPAERVKAVDRLAPWGATALYDVLLRGVEMLGRQTGRKALVVFTDGEDQGSHATINDVERRLQSSDVTLYMIGQGRGVTMEPLKKIMERLSVPTGGRGRRVSPTASTSSTGRSPICSTSSPTSTLLGYPSTNSKRDDAWRKIKVDRSTAIARCGRGKATARWRANERHDRKEPRETAEHAAKRSLWFLLAASWRCAPVPSSRWPRRRRAAAGQAELPVVGRGHRRSTSAWSTIKGKPITNLTPADHCAFRIDGNNRRVVSAEWVPLNADSGAAAAPLPPDGYSTNESDTGGTVDRDRGGSAQYPVRRHAGHPQGDERLHRSAGSLGSRRRRSASVFGAPSTNFVSPAIVRG